jgi:hypothetical protein
LISSIARQNKDGQLGHIQLEKNRRLKVTRYLKQALGMADENRSAVIDAATTIWPNGWTISQAGGVPSREKRERALQNRGLMAPHVLKQGV